MEKFYRMVIDLYKEATNGNYQVNSERILEVRKEIACAITAAKIENKPTSFLESLNNDIIHLQCMLP